MLESYIEDHNLSSTSRLELVTFQYVVQHVSRLSRVLAQPAGHALLIGLSGSGRQSATTLAAFMHRFQLFKVRDLGYLVVLKCGWSRPS